jgi:hypothetical protein
VKRKESKTTIKRQNREVALLLIGVCSFYLYKFPLIWLTLPFTLLLLAIFSPHVFSPIRFFWFTLGEVLGAISSRIILTLTYFLVLIPVAILKRRNFQKRFHLNDFKECKKSILQFSNEKEFSKEDIIKPY